MKMSTPRQGNGAASRAPGRVPLKAASALAAAFALHAVAAGSAWASARPQTISPGSEDEPTAVETTCPTFSWGAGRGVESWELVVYDPAPAASSTRDARPPVLRRTIPGAALTWTPDLVDCLEPGRPYAWALRARDAAGEPASTWSEPRMFRVASRAAQEDLAWALEVLTGYAGVAAGDLTDFRSTAPVERADEVRTTTELQAGAADPGPSPLALTAADTVGMRARVETGVVGFGLHGLSGSTGAGSAGLVGQSTALSGATTGVVGEVASPAGAAGVFDNTAGGSILRGLVNGVEVFAVDGTGGVSATSFTGDGTGLTNVDAATLGGSPSSAFASATHHHDDRYFTETELTTGGGGGSLHWDNLTSVPLGFADGVDNDTTYTAGTGLEMNGTELSRAPLETVPAGNTVSTLDSGGTVGEFSSITLGADGLGLISYWDATHLSLKVAHCDDVECSSASTATLDGTVGAATSITLGADGLGLISYATSGGLKAAHCDDDACSSATVSLLTSGSVGDTSIALGADGVGIIAYRDVTAGAVKIAHCNDVACSAASTSTLSSGAQAPSIALGADGLAVISFDTPLGLQVAHCDNAVCTTFSVNSIDSAAGASDTSSITIGVDGLPLVGYYVPGPAQFKVAHCDDPACSTSTTTNIVPSGNITSSLTLGTDGLGLIAVFDHDTDILKLAHCHDVACSAASLFTLALNARGGSITLGTDGLPLISYDGETLDLVTSHCSNSYCVPYLQP